MQSEPNQSGPGEPHHGPLTARRIKVTIWVVAVIMALIIIWQNWEEMDTRILFMTVRMPKFLFIILMILIGFVIGMSSPSLWKKGKDGR